MTPAEKARVFSEMMRPTQQLARAGIESRHPGASEQEIRLRLMALRLDRETMTAREVPPRSVSKAHGRKISTLIPKKFPDARRLLGERSPELAKGVADRSSDVARRVADRRGGVLGGVADFARRLAHDSAAEARARGVAVARQSRLGLREGRAENSDRREGPKRETTPPIGPARALCLRDPPLAAP